MERSSKMSASPPMRIDQFFASRKKRLTSPSKSVKANKSAKTEWDSSPSAKGTLDAYFIDSGEGFQTKRNLMMDAGTTVEAGHKPTFSLKNVNYKDDPGKTEVSTVVPEDVPLENSCLPAVSNSVNGELRKFAVGLLSFYCSELSSGLTSSLEQNRKGQNGSGEASFLPSDSLVNPKLLLSDNKQLCLEEVSCSNGQLSEHVASCQNIISAEADDSHPADVKAAAVMSDLGLKKCSNVLGSKLGISESDKLVDTLYSGETPQSAKRCFTSPGDAFWTEAIQVVDGLFAIANKQSTQISKSIDLTLSELHKDPHVLQVPVQDSGKTKCLELTGSKSRKNVKLQLISSQRKPSPLPVRHFDFSFIEKHSHEDDSCNEERHTNKDSENRTLSPLSAAENEISDLVNKGSKGEISSCKYEEGGTPSNSLLTKDSLCLSNWIPSEICCIYMKKGIARLYPWQVECLMVEGVLQGRNLVYCASTSAGKSFVAEILMLRRVLTTSKMALIVLPYVSICVEKAEHLEGLLKPLGKHVRSFYGSLGGTALPKDTSVAVCTIEKANSLVNHLLEEGRLSELGIIVIDELHMVGDLSRGYLLELLLTKLRYAGGEGVVNPCDQDSSGSSSGMTEPSCGLQIVGMSATMPNLSVFANWLQAALYETDFRPVPLEEYIKVGRTIFDKKMTVIRQMSVLADHGGKDPDHITELCNEVVQEGHSVLLFCSTRKGCESTARHVSKLLTRFSPFNQENSEHSDISLATEALGKCPAGLDKILEETLPSGVGYHHAGLTVEEREIVESCYRRGHIHVLVATSTLAAGVNLPARRVIFRQPRIGRDFIDGTRYRQMAGRAGRTGIDTKGESVLICKPEEAKRVAAMLSDSCLPLQSCLSEDKNGMTHAILEVVAGGIVQTASDVHRYVRCTLLNSTRPFEDVVISAQESLRWLCHQKFLEWNEETKLYTVTPLGRAAFGSSLNPEESLVVLEDLVRAREGFVLASDLHLVYLVTPLTVGVEPDWKLYYERFMELSATDQSVGNRVGIVEAFLMKMAHGVSVQVHKRFNGDRKFFNRNSCDQVAASCSLSDQQMLRVSKRFYVALMLSRLVQEVSVLDVCEAFHVSRGMVQSLQENAGRFAMMVSLFCDRLGWQDLGGLVAKFQNRVFFGVRAEIAELTAIPYVKGSRARALYKAGLRTPAALAEAPVHEIAKAISDCSSWSEQGSSLSRMHFGVAKKIKKGACKVVLDQAEEARLAAFSAFRSLGVAVPQVSHPLVAHREAVTHFPKYPIEVMSATLDKDGSPKVSHLIARSEDKSTFEGIELALIASQEKPALATLENKMVILDGSSLSRMSSLQPGSEMEDVIQDGGSMPPIIGSASDRTGPINVDNIRGGYDSFMDILDNVEEFFFDIHFTVKGGRDSFVPFEIHGIAICWKSSPVYYISLPKSLIAYGRKLYPGFNSEGCNHIASSSSCWDVIRNKWDRLSKIMGKTDVRKITWSMKIQIQVLKIPAVSVRRFDSLDADKRNCGFQLVGSSFILPPIYVNFGIDMCLAVWVLWPDEESICKPSLEKEVKRRLSSEVAAAANRDGRWRNQMHKAAHNGCCRRVAQTRALASSLWNLLSSENLLEPLISIEVPMVKVLADMELWGIGVDMEVCLRARHLLGAKLKDLEKEAYRLAGMTFSLYNVADVANVLYEQLKLPEPASSKKGKQHPSTNKHALELLRDEHPIVSVIKEHRTLSKLLNCTLRSICARSSLCSKSQKYTIWCNWLQTSTATGRLSMEDPNLQCVEHTVDFKMHESDKSNIDFLYLDYHQKVNPRDILIPSQDNWLLLGADYSQIELRLMAHFSRDHFLIELLSKPDGDVFKMMAARWNGKPESCVSSEERDQTKKLVYGVLYGMGANMLAKQLGCCFDAAVEKIQNFRDTFAGVSSWLHEAVTFCHKTGYVETLKGRKRFLAKINEGQRKEKSKAQRQAVNSICQGSAADIIKMAMIKIHSVIVGQPASAIAAQFSVLKGRCRILLQIHDELLLEVDPSLVNEAGLLLKASMESAASLLVPLRIKLKIGRKWGSLEYFNP